MIRPRQQRKHIEEVYGPKLDANKFQVAPAAQQNVAAKPGNFTERAYNVNNGNSVAPCKQQPAPPPPSTVTISEAVKHSNSGKETTRRKSARPANKFQTEKHFVRETFTLKEDRKSAEQPIKSEKHLYITPLNVQEPNKMCGNSNKELELEVVPQYQQHRQQHHHHKPQSHHHHNSHDEDKDDDTDEFFDLIRHTVEGAIGKSVSELLNRNFKELSSKVERVSADLKNTNALLYQMQKELNNRISHYGEENSWHFRYLCMKSEYDKMFYQHQTLIAAAKPLNDDTSSKTKSSERRKSFAKASKSAQKLVGQEGEKINPAAPAAAACSYHNAKCQQRIPDPQNLEPHKSSSGDVSLKSTDVDIREVLQHIQKFCTHMQFNNVKCEQSCEGPGTSQKRSVIKNQDVMQINKEAFAGHEADQDDDDDDDDVWEISSDGMTPRNKSNDKYGGTTAGGDITQRENLGAGDA